MAVIQISKIQVRRGLQENLPQLASAEFGWSIDDRRLYIGNGTLAEGAPSIGNTEILTQYTDLMNLLEEYIFVGDESGYTSQTGPSAIADITRSLQDKLDEQISVRDFGAVGDGVTDDTTAIQRALNQIYPSAYYSTLGVRRKIHVPAGTYILTANITVPPYTSLYGDGIESTVIKQTGNVLVTANPELLVLTSGGGSYPSNVTVQGMTLFNSTANDVVVAVDARDVTFEKVKMMGSNVAIGGNNAFSISSTAGQPENFYFDQCTFTGTTQGLYAYGNVKLITVENSEFSNLYLGASLSNDGSGLPSGTVFSKSNFDEITSVAVRSDSLFTSELNYFGNVAGTGLASFPQEYDTVYSTTFGNTISYVNSINDTFEYIYQGNVVTDIFNKSGTLQKSIGYSVELIGGETTANTGTISSSVVKNFVIDYSIERDSSYRTGTITAINDGSAVTFNDEHSENTTTGVVLGFSMFGSNAAFVYTTTAGNTATLNYSLRHFQ